jgi:hypothetical protein
MNNGFLKQSTAAQSRLVGPFLDDTDFKTTETALTIANTDVKLSANGAAGANKNSGGGTHRNNGMYSLTFDATDTATVGELGGSIVVAGALPVVFKFVVLEEAVYDALFGASAPGYLQPATAGRQLVVDAAGLADANTVKVGPSGSGTAQTAGDVIGDTNDIQSRLPAALVGGRMDSSVGAFAAGQGPRYRKNVAALITFPMTDATTHVRSTGKTVTAQVSIDGAVFVNCAGAVAEIGATGIYKLSATNADMNGDNLIFLFTATGCDDLPYEISPNP